MNIQYVTYIFIRCTFSCSFGSQYHTLFFSLQMQIRPFFLLAGRAITMKRASPRRSRFWSPFQKIRPDRRAGSVFRFGSWLLGHFISCWHPKRWSTTTKSLGFLWRWNGHRSNCTMFGVNKWREGTKGGWDFLRAELDRQTNLEMHTVTEPRG